MLMNEQDQQLFLTKELTEQLSQLNSQQKEQDPNPLSQLSDSTLKTICYEAADEHELAAHLEALGYNSYRTKKEFGMKNTFELASELYKYTNRQAKTRFKIKPLRDLRKQQTVLLVAVIVTMMAFLQESIHWGTMLWIIVWSFMGNSLIGKASTEWSKKEGQMVLTIVLYLGVLGFFLMGLIFGFEVFAMTVAIFWWTVAGWVWRQKIYEEINTFIGFIPSFLLLLNTAGPLVFNLQPWPAFTCFLMLSLAVFLARRELIWPKKEAWHWMLKDIPDTLLMGLYGFGQGVLLMHLIKSTKDIGVYWSIFGLALCTLLIIMAERLVIWLKSALTELMWSDDLRSRQHYRRFVETIILRYSLLPVLVLLVIILIANYDVNNDIIKYIPIIGFALLGISLNFALALMSLNDVQVAQISFGVVGILSLIGLSPSFLLMFLIIVLFGRLIVYAKHIEQYGISLL